nr:hypothetical protein [uncultured Psychroserpens sp.]
MEQRTRISANIKLKKYVLSWFVMVVAYIITNFFDLNQFWDFVTWSLAMLIFLLFISLRKLEFSEKAVYFDSKRIEYENIIALKTFEINGRPYYLFKTNAKSLIETYYLTQLEGIGYFSILKILFSKNKNKKLPIADFLMLLDEKANI